MGERDWAQLQYNKEQWRFIAREHTRDQKMKNYWEETSRVREDSGKTA